MALVRTRALRTGPSGRRARATRTHSVHMRATVLVPVLDEARHLERALGTAAAQQLDGGLEILVIDGGSTDGSRDLVARMALDDPRIHLLDNPAGRTPNALNIGLRA